MEVGGAVKFPTGAPRRPCLLPRPVRPLQEEGWEEEEEGEVTRWDSRAAQGPEERASPG